MAWLDLPPSGIYQIGFRYGNRKIKKSLDTSNPQIAERARARFEENLSLVRQGRLDIPEGADVAEFLLFDGKLTIAAKPEADAKPETEQQQPAIDAPLSQMASVPSSFDASKAGLIPASLETVFNEYLVNLPQNSLAEQTLRIARIHFAHLKHVLGPETVLYSIDRDRLLDYVNARSQETGRRGKPLSAVTIKKELGTFSSVWTWAKDKYVAAEFPAKQLRFPVTIDKPEFQTMAEVQRKISLGHLSSAEEEELWDCVFLTLPEIDELLEHVHRKAAHPFLYAMLFSRHIPARDAVKCVAQKYKTSTSRENESFCGNESEPRENTPGG